MEEKNKLVVKIAGREYTIISSENSEYMYQIASLVNKEMRLIMASNSRISVDMASVLVALNAKDKEKKLTEENRNLVEKLKLYDSSTEALMAKNKALSEELETKLAESESESEDLSSELSAELAATKGALQQAEQDAAEEKKRADRMQETVENLKAQLENAEKELSEVKENLAQKEHDLDELLS